MTAQCFSNGFCLVDPATAERSGVHFDQGQDIRIQRTQVPAQSMEADLRIPQVARAGHWQVEGRAGSRGVSHVVDNKTEVLHGEVSGGPS